MRLFGEFSALWVVLVARGFAFHSFANNEVDVLPAARQFVERDWLPQDWYLNLDVGYRQLFNVLAGPLVSELGFQQGAVIGRLLVYLLFAGALLFFIRVFRIRLAFALIVLVLFLNNQTLVAGEWMVGGFETKALAYPFVLLAFASFYSKRWTYGFAFAGAALSFHVLVGLYALFCLAAALALTRERWREEWRPALGRSWVFLVTGAWGIIAIAQQLLAGGGGESARGWEVYAEVRVPHHVLPSAWDDRAWPFLLLLAVALFLAMYFRGRTSRGRFLAAYGLASVALFLVGLIVYAFGETSLLRYYWFRFPDTIVPFLVLMTLALIASDYAERRPIFGPGAREAGQAAGLMPRRWLLSLGNVGAAVVLVLSLVEIATGALDPANREWGDPQSRPMFRWIAQHTPEEAVFLVDPFIEDFYVHANRAQYVSFKHSPQAAADVLEWYGRLVQTNGGQPPRDRGFELAPELRRNFYELDEDAIRDISREHGVVYYLGQSDRSLAFEAVYSTADLTLYRIDT